MPKKDQHTKKHDNPVNSEETQVFENSENPEPEKDDPLEQMTKERDELKDSYLRLAADIDNYKKRTQKEKEDYQKYALKNLLENLLPVLDNFSRSLQAEGDIDTLKQGVQMIYTQLETLLQETGLQKIDITPGVEFNPQEAEALMMEENPEAEFSLTVAEVFENGWRIGEHVLRSAKVKVYKKD